MLLSVGATAGRLGVAPATVRSWGRRYGLVPAGRTAGGHRRYTQEDLRRLMHMQELVSAGATPAAAARTALAESPAAPGEPMAPRSSTGPSRVRTRRPGGPGGQVLSVPGASREVRGLARAAGRLDADATVEQVRELLVGRGAVATWNEVLRPVLEAVGIRWMRTGEGIDIEHVLSESTMEALRAYRAFLPRPAPGRPVLLASAPSDMHTLPLHVLAAAMAEYRVPTRLLGSCVPGPVLASAARRIGASAVFVWRQLIPESGAEYDLAALPRTRPALTVVVGGPGWNRDALPARVQLATDVETALRLLTRASR